MSTRPLHPNLAKLAANYDEIIERYANGTLGAVAAQREIAALVARDDEGILWSIDPTTGDWLRKTRSGELVPGEPPAYGLETATPHDISGARRNYLSEERVHLLEVDDELLYSPSRFAGSTRNLARTVNEGRFSSGIWGAKWLIRSVVGVAVASLIIVSILAATHPRSSARPGSVATSSTTSTIH